MKLIFDKYGHLADYNRIEIGEVEFKQFFVDAFPSSQTRVNLFKNWYIYNQNLKSLLQVSTLRQWINGSFVTSKQEPKDVDFVTFIPSFLFEKYENELEAFWSFSLEDKGLDAYLVKEYPSDSLVFDNFQAIETLWNKRFVEGRNPLFKKGYVEVIV